MMIDGKANPVIEHTLRPANSRAAMRTGIWKEETYA